MVVLEIIHYLKLVNRYGAKPRMTEDEKEMMEDQSYEV